MGNAIERLGKNVIGFRAMMLEVGIIPCALAMAGTSMKVAHPRPSE